MGRSRLGERRDWVRDDGEGDSAEPCSVKLCVYKIPCSSNAWIHS